RILARLEELGRPLPQLLQPGLTRAQIDAHTAHLPFRLPEEVCRLYMWRNGTATGEDVLLADIVLFDSKHFLPLEEALEIHRQIPQDPDHYSDVYDPELVEALDGATLFPLFSDGFGGYYTVACRPEPSQTGLMIDDFGGGAEPRLAFPSLTRMMSVLADLYEAGVEAPFLEEEDST
ncbi:MAG TPA: SMI1/KNR4 family protein, partial [Armatimonadota bacterium]|nr:SMI1/KNR4 family protein [Armatimonadota bacterium]